MDIDLNYLLYQLTYYLGFVYPALLLACGIAAAVRLPGTAARVLCGAGFGLAFVNSLYHLGMRLSRLGYEPELFLHRIGGFLSLLGVLGWGFVCIGLFVVRRSDPDRRESSRTRYEDRPDYDTPRRDAPYRPRRSDLPLPSPGWGLVATWIALSVLSLLASVASFALFVDAGRRISDREAVPIFAAVGLAILTLIPATIVLLVWLYKTWAAVPYEHRSASPGQAVGFLFIPLFSLYWVFRAVPGLSASIRRANRSIYGDKVGDAGFGFSVAACVLALIPYIGVLSWPLFVIWILLANGAKNQMLRGLARDEPDSGLYVGGDG